MIRMNWVWASAGLTALLAASPAWATLGEKLDSVQSDATSLKTVAAARSLTATASIATSAAYTVQRMTLPSSVVVDEYVDASGNVFAVSWSGMRPPDLSQLFGAYFAEYQTASTQPHVRTSHVQLDTGRMKYYAGGHMRAYWGLALVPALLPAGVTAENLQ